MLYEAIPSTELQVNLDKLKHMVVVVVHGATEVHTARTAQLDCLVDPVVVETVTTQVQTVAEVAYNLVSTRVLVKVITILVEILDQLQANPIVAEAEAVLVAQVMAARE
jgi:hypothetical protein